MAINQKSFTFDSALRLKDAGAVTASGNGQVGGSDRILDLGAARFDGRVIVDITAIDVASADETYLIRVQGSNSPTFAATNKTLATLEVGRAAATGSSAADAAGTRAEVAVTNEFNGVTYRYLRVSHVLGGTTPSINYIANLVPQAH